MVVYKIENLINGKIYIGQDKHDDSEYYGSGLNILRAIKKYGKENFKKTIIENCDSQESLNEREIYWISHYRKIAKVYNIRKGGEGGFTSSEMKQIWQNLSEDERKVRLEKLAQNRTSPWKNFSPEIKATLASVGGKNRWKNHKKKGS